MLSVVWSTILKIIKQTTQTRPKWIYETLSKICKNGKKVTMDVVIVYQADQVVAVLHLQNKNGSNEHLSANKKDTCARLQGCMGVWNQTSSSNFRDASPSGYKQDHPLDQISNASSFHTIKLTGSTIVGWMISLAGNTPHVTAFTSVWPALDIQFPFLFTAM